MLCERDQVCVRIGGIVEGSVRGLVRSIEVSGAIGDDLAVVAGNVDVTGTVGRDLLMAGANARFMQGYAVGR